MKSTRGCIFDTVMHMPTNHGDDQDAQADKEQLAAVRVAVDEVDEQIVSSSGAGNG